MRKGRPECVAFLPGESAGPQGDGLGPTHEGFNAKAGQTNYKQTIPSQPSLISVGKVHLLKFTNITSTGSFKTC